MKISEKIFRETWKDVIRQLADVKREKKNEDGVREKSWDVRTWKDIRDTSTELSVKTWEEVTKWTGDQVTKSAMRVY